MFDPPAVEALSQSARRLPRRINRTAHYALTAAAAAKGARTAAAEHIEHAVAEAAPMNLSYLLVPHQLSDEAAAQLSELLNDLAVAFHGQHFAQIIRYYDERRDNERPCHHRQLELFVDDNGAF